MSHYDNEPEPIYEREERREAKEQASIERGEMNRVNPFYCMKTESAMLRCRNQCQPCADVEKQSGR